MMAVIWVPSSMRAGVAMRPVATTLWVSGARVTVAVSTAMPRGQKKPATSTAAATSSAIR
jgi:hypothetical protein